MLSRPAPAFSAEQHILTNAAIVLQDEVIRGSLRIEGGMITDIAPGRSAVPGAVDIGGDFLCPGLIELHTDNLERHLKPRPGVAWPVHRAALAHDAELAGTGIATVFDALRVGSVVSEEKAGYGKYARGLCDALLDLRAQGAMRISHRVHLRAEICSETLIEELDEFGPDDRVGLISLMDHTPGQRQFTDLTQMRLYLRSKHAMSEHEVDAYLAYLCDLRARFGAAHEAQTVQRARDWGAVLASHDDTTAGHVAASAGHGISLAEFPTTREAARACRENGIAIMMGAPNLLRGKSHSGNVSALELLEDDLLDILSSDYVPAALLAAAVQVGRVTGSMAGGLARVTSAPAAAAALDDRGRIAIGLRADLLRFRMVGDTPIPVSLSVLGERVA